MAACALFIGAAGSAHAADWRLQAHFPGELPRPNLPLLGISCPSKSFCVAVGEDDAVASSPDPTGGASKWKMVQPDGEAESDCHSSWIPPCMPTTARRVRGLSCPTPQLCVAVTAEGYVYSSREPGGSGDDWRVADIDGPGADTHLMGVSCPTTSMCVAVSGERHTGGKVLWSTDPTGGASAWNEAQLDETLQFTGISCGTPGFCVAVAEHGRIVVSTNPTGGAGAWREVGTPGGPGDLQGVSCVGSELCVTGNSGGNLLFSTNPGGGASAWDEADGGVSVQITGVSCLPSHQCAAVDNNGDVLTTDDPTAGREAWSRINLIPYSDPTTATEAPLNALFGVSCVSSTFCAVAGADGEIFTSEDPFGPPGAAAAPGTGHKKKKPRRPHVKIARFFGNFYLRDRHAKDRVGFRFHAVGMARRYLCRRDSGPFRPCRSPYRYLVGLGRHVFRVRAVGLTGLRGPVAVKRFRIVVHPSFPHHR